MRYRVDAVRQPSAGRDRNWRGWLVTVARREAWRLDAERYTTMPIAHGDEANRRASVAEPPDPRDPQDQRLGLVAVTDVLEQLPPCLRQMAFLRAAGMHYGEIAEMHDLSRTRVNHLVTRANDRIRQITGRVPREDLTPRGQRLHDLEEEPLHG